MKNQVSAPQNPQSGNIFFWIFIMIFLVGALSVALTRGTRTSSSTISGEQAKLAASEMIAYGTQIRNTVKAMMINGCSETQLNFGNTIWKKYSGSDVAGPNHNPNTPGNQCKVFEPTGGGLLPIIFPDNGKDVNVAHVVSGHTRIYNMKVQGVGTAKEDLVLSTVYIDQNVCMEINNMLGIQNLAAAPPPEQATQITYNGTFAETSTEFGLISPVFSGKMAGCYRWQGSNNKDNHFYQVLIAR